MEEAILLDAEVITQMLDAEITWYKENQNTVTPEQSEWFIKGLLQAKLLIAQFAKDVQAEDRAESHIPPNGFMFAGAVFQNDGDKDWCSNGN